MRKDDSVRLAGRDVVYIATASGAGVLNVEPSSFARASSIASSFTFYRFRRLRFRILPNVATTSGSPALALGQEAIVGYQPEETMSATPENLIPTAHFALLGFSSTAPAQTVPSEWREVPMARLAGNVPLKWYATSIDEEEAGIQGQLWVHTRNSSGLVTASAGQVAVPIEIDWQVEFRGVHN